MKRTLFNLITVLLICQACQQTEQKRELRFSNLQEQFADPGAEFRTAPLWVWNTDVTTADIDRMLTELKQQGFGGAFVHPRPGLETEYLSPEWFQLWDYALQKGKELGLLISIYDENSYPSGFGGGHVPDRMPEAYNQGQVLLGSLSREVPDSCYMCLMKQGGEYINITDKLAEYKGKDGEYCIYQLGCYGASNWTAGFPYVDLMAKGVTEKFIEVTMTEGYEKYFGNRLGTEIKNIFTDEPNISTPYGGHCRWTPDLFDTFQQMWGYDLRTHWPQLGEESGDWKKVRHDYNATLLRLFIDRWCKPWHDYCERKGMLWTGHYWEHAWPDLSQGPDNMAMYAWHQMPAIDMLFNQFDDNDNCRAQFGNIRSVKELRSVANQKGRVRTLSETYGGGGWDETLTDLKRLGDWEFALGVNFMNQHLSHMTITGARKFDYPPEFTSLSPWWQDYGVLNDYFARLSLVLSQGRQQNGWLILEPTTSLWLHFTNVAGGEPLWNIARTFQSLLGPLEKGQMEYDLGCEDIIRDCGSVDRKQLRIGQALYHTVVLPPFMENLESRTFQLLRDFSDRGGRIITLGSPDRVDGEENAELKAFMQSAAVIKMQSAEEVLSLYRQETDLQMECPKDSHVYHYRCRYEDGQLLFMVNSSLTDEAGVSFSIPGKFLYRLDALTGRIFLHARAEEGQIEVKTKLYPAGSALWFVSDREALNAEPEEVIPNTLKPLQAQDETEVQPLRANVLNLDFCNLTVGGTSQPDLYYKEANGRMWQHFGQGDPWETAVQFRRRILERDSFPEGEIQLEYPFMVEEDFDRSGMTAIIEKPWMWDVSVNDIPVKDYSVDTLLDCRMGDYAIGNLVRLGRNKITLHMQRMNIRAELGPVMLTGKFGVKGADKGFALTAAPQSVGLGDYSKTGYPEYPWEMCYTKLYQVDNPDQDFFVQLGRWNGTVAQVWVNGQKAGIIAWQPYRLNVRPCMKSGCNRVEVRIIGSNANLYGPHYAPLTGLMGPGSWNGVGNQLPGDQYRLSPYGLDEDFILLFGS
jgi:hypothetical protein